jgi:outer membrane protein insertion porin family
MRVLRLVFTGVVSVYLCASLPQLRAQQPPQQQTPPPQPPPAQPPTTPAQPPATPAQPPKPATGGFESVPAQQTPQTPPPRAPQLEAPRKAPTTPVPLTGGRVIAGIEFRGARRTPQDTLKAQIYSKQGDIYSEDQVRRDYMLLWNTGKFDDITLETEDAPEGLIVRFVLTERRVIRAIHYQGNKSISESEILDRFKERKVGLTVEQQYDPGRVQRAASVIKEYEAERGHQYATVDPQVEQQPPSALNLTFVVNEGPKVKVGEINITGNNSFSKRWVISQMKETHPYGVPHSIFLESVFPKTFDTDKLEYDIEKLREAYNDKGYFQAKILDPDVRIIQKGGKGWRLPLIKPNNLGIFADIHVPIEEGRLYHLRKAEFQGVKLFRDPQALLPLFNMRIGDVFSTDKLRKGLENLRKYYGILGYWDFSPEPDVQPIPDTDQVDITITADEGHQFFVRRIDFVGNTTTRDKVIRREFLLDEGDIFNKSLLDTTVLRLNQLGYFDPLKVEDAIDIKRNPQSDTVDITLKVKERGKNSIGLNGGVSGIAGSFVGFNYSTNNFLGLGETLSLNAQVGTIQDNVSLGFSEPFFLDRPMQVGFTVYYRRFDFNQGREASILEGQNLTALYNDLGANNLLNYIQNSRGVTINASYPLRRHFARLGLTLGYEISNVKTLTTAADNYFQFLNFSGVYGPNSLNGIRTATITPSYLYNTVNHPISPTAGKSIYLGMGFAATFLGGNVNLITPTADLKYFHLSPIGRKHGNVLAFHLLATLSTGFNGKNVPPFDRGFIGGEQDVRGFQIMGITPIGWVPSTTQIPVFNSNGTPRTTPVVSNGTIVNTPVNMTIPVYQLVTPGGDTRIIGNFEHRIPIIPNVVTLAPFFDVGVDRIIFPHQLTLAPQRTEDLNTQFPSAAFTGQIQIAPGTQRIRTSTGLELQVMLPVVNAPFRVYFAYNPTNVREYLQPPIVADPSLFPNNATFQATKALFNPANFPFFEQNTTFRFTVGRTF